MRLTRTPRRALRRTGRGGAINADIDGQREERCGQHFGRDPAHDGEPPSGRRKEKNVRRPVLQNTLFPYGQRAYCASGPAVGSG
jgi:hypothetical protein